MTTSIQTENISHQQRLDYVDMAKSIGMLTIIWGHIVLTGWSNCLVYSFHIPLFFFLSGMMFNGAKYTSLWEFVKRRIKTLLVPYVMFSFVTWALWAVMSAVTHSHGNLWKPLLQTFIAQGSGGFMLHNVPLWFVTCLFVVELIYFFVNKLPNWLNIVICIICALVGDYMIRGGHLSFFRLLPWSIEGAMSALLFYSLGNLLIKKVSHQKLVEIIRERKLVIIPMIAVLTVLLYFSANWNGHVTLGSNSLGRNTLVFYANAFVGIFTTISFSVLLTLIEVKNVVGEKIMAYMKWFGRNSFFVMASHFPVILAVVKVFHSTPAGVSSSVKLSLITFALTIIIDSVIVLCVTMLKKHDESLVRKRKEKCLA